MAGCSEPLPIGRDTAASIASAVGLAPAPRPIWLREGDETRANALLEAFARADRHGRDPDSYRTPALLEALAQARAAPSDPALRQRADRALSSAFLAWLDDLDRPDRRWADVHVADAHALPARADPGRLLIEAAEAPDIRAHLAALERRHPIYDALADALARARAEGRPPETLALLAGNLERARALPARLPDRHILVDTAAQTLWLYEGDRVVDRMAVVVGAPSMPTPFLAGVLRFVVTDPYWNVPEDLARLSIAPAVLRHGAGWLAQRRMEALSGWEEDAVRLAPAEVDWAALAAGRSAVRIRQQPHAGNMMGHMKFMLPNRLGIYLHDTPYPAHFARADRALSAGCIRVADWRRLAAWLFDGAMPMADGTPERAHHLPRPVPVHITHLTLKPEAGTLVARRDPYGRDSAALAASPGALAGDASSRRPAASTT